MIHLIGDLQGCAAAFDRLLDLIGFSPSRDRIVLLGDLVNRGPDSLRVLRRAMALDNAATCLLGNHDLHLLAVAAGVRKLQRGDTLQPVLDDPSRDSLIDWLRRQPLAHVEAGWLCVHAGVPPAWSAAQALACADEVERLLRGRDHVEFLSRMIGREPRRWSDALSGPDRWRFTVNALTRMRWVERDGTLDFDVKEGPSDPPAGLLPWFEAPRRLTSRQPIAFGHWSALGLLNQPLLLGLDTGCVWGGALSAVRVDDGRRELVSVPCEDRAAAQ